MGKKKVLREGKLSEVVLLSANDVLGVATKLLGFDRVMVVWRWSLAFVSNSW